MCWNSFKCLSKTRPRAIVAVFIALMLFCCVYGCQEKADQNKPDVINLKFSSAYIPSDWPNTAANHALDLVEKKTNGRVKIDRFMGGVLGSIPEHLDMVSSGAVDIIPLHVDQFSQQLPLHKILNTEQFVSSEQALANITAITMEIPETKAILDAEQQRNNIKILYWHVVGASGITTRFPAKSLSDLKGRKINVITGFQRKVFGELGIIPVNVQVSELYESLSRGIIDSIYMGTVAAVPSKWYEVGETHLILGDNTVVSIPITLNLDRWNSLPEDIKQAFLEASEETARWTIEEMQRIVENTYEIFDKSGVEIANVSRDESNNFFEVFSRHATEDWLNNAKEMGVNEEASVIQKYWDDMKWGRWTK